MDERQILCLSTEIGRGHPSYLDSVFELLTDKFRSATPPKAGSPSEAKSPALRTQAEAIRLSYRTVFELSRGISFISWKLAEKLYLIGGRGGMMTNFYNRFRRSQRAEGFLALRILGRDLQRSLRGFQGICLVEHPLVAKILAGVCRVWYVHGEIAAPKECAIKGVEKIFVPTEETKNKLIVCDSDPSSLVVTGLLIEPGLKKIAQNSFDQRKQRIKSETQLTVGFFTSGAYPKEHIQKIIAGAKSVLEQNMRAIVFAGTNERICKKIENEISKWKVRLVMDKEDLLPSEKDWDIMLVSRKTRQRETLRTVELFPLLDLFVAASHERTNWACGLGLPIFVLSPLIGTFAQQNFEFTQKQGVAYPLESLGSAEDLGKTIHTLREDGNLFQMAENGFGLFTIDGAEKVVKQIFADG